MHILHIDLSRASEDYADLRYGWENPNAFEPRRLPLAEIRELIALMERDYYVALPEDLVKTGRRLYQWLDGSDRWLAQLLDQRLNEAKTDLVVLAMTTSKQLAHLPWELLHDGNGFLVARACPVVPVRFPWKAAPSQGILTPSETPPPK